MICIVLLFYVDSKSRNTLTLLENRNGVFPLHYGQLIFKNAIDTFMAIVLKGRYIEIGMGGSVYGDGREQSSTDTPMVIIFKILGSDAWKPRQDFV